MSWPYPQQTLCSGTSEAPRSVSRVSSVVGLHLEGQRGITRALPARRQSSSSASISHALLLLHLSPCGRHLTPCATKCGAWHTPCRHVPHTMCHAPHTKRAPAAVISRVARPHDAMGSVRHMSHAALLRTRGRQAVAAMHLTLGAHGEAFHSAHQLLPARASVAPVCQGRAQTTDAAVRALPPLRRRYALASNPPLGPACTHLHGQTSSSYRRTSEQCFSAARSQDPPC